MKLLEYHALRSAEEKSWDRTRLEEQAGIAEQVTALLPTTRGEYRPNGLIEIKWDATCDALAQLCNLYRSSSSVQQTYIRSRIDHIAAGRLEGFGLRSAVLGAREHSADRLRSALTAFAIADLAGTDVRDSMIALTLVFHCATLAGTDASALFNEAAAICGPAMQALLYTYTDAGKQPSGIGSMGWYQVDTPEGVGFTTVRPNV